MRNVRHSKGTGSPGGSLAGALVLAIVAACSGTPATAAHPLHRTGPLAVLETSRDLDGALVGTSEARATVVFVFASWCGNCHHELAILARLRPAHPGMRVLGVNYGGHEDYAARGSSSAVRRYVAEHAPWLTVIPADEPLFALLGRPPKVPTMFIYDRAGTLVETYDRRDRALPDAGELAAILRRLGA